MEGYLDNKKKDQVSRWFTVILIFLGITAHTAGVENLEN